MGVIDSYLERTLLEPPFAALSVAFLSYSAIRIDVDRHRHDIQIAYWKWGTGVRYAVIVSRRIGTLAWMPYLVGYRRSPEHLSANGCLYTRDSYSIDDSLWSRISLYTVGM